MKQNTLSNLILIAYLLMMIVSLVSAVDLFTLSHPSFAFGWIMSVAIEISIAALLIVNRKVPGIKSVLYVLGFITLFQICANTYSAYIHIENISPFAELFALDEWEVIDQKRMLAFATGGVLPAICLALIYIQNEVREQTETNKTDNKEPDDKAYNTEDVQIPSDEDGGEAEGASSPKSHIDQPISEPESESEETPAPQQQGEGAKGADINTKSEEQAEIAIEQLSGTDESNDQSEDTVEPEAAVEEPKKRKYTKKSTSKSTSKTTKKTSKKTKTTKSNKKPKASKASKASKKAEEQTSADEVSVTDVPESDPDSQSQESVAELAERLNDIRRGKHNPVSNGYSMML